MISSYNFSGIKWSVRDSKKNLKEALTVKDFYSWGVFTTPTRYNSCSLKNQALRKCVFDSQQFVGCDFSHIDASDSQFVDCLFLDCRFTNANFGKTIFRGCAIVQTSNEDQTSIFEGAGMSQSQFLESDRQKTVLINTVFRSLGFRHSVFRNVLFQKVRVNHASFENALLVDCNIDRFDITESSCRGIVFKNCTISEYISTVEKTIGSIGGLEMLKKCKKINLKFGSLSITKIDEVIDLFVSNENTLRFAKHGKLFEFINIMQFLYTESTSHKREYINAHQIVLSAHTIDGFEVTEYSEYLSSACIDAYNRILEKGEYVDQDNILYILKLMYFLNIRDYKFYKVLEVINENILLKSSNQEDYSYTLTNSQINYYLEKVGSTIHSNAYNLTLLNKTADWEDRANRIEFEDFITELLQKSGITQYNIVSLHEGSTEIIVKLLSPAYIWIMLLILGIEFEFDKKNGIRFKFNPSNGIKSYGEFLEKIVSVLPFLGKKTIDEDEYSKRASSASESMKLYIQKQKISGGIEQQTASPKRVKNKTSTTKLNTPPSIGLGNKDS